MVNKTIRPDNSFSDLRKSIVDNSSLSDILRLSSYSAESKRFVKENIRPLGGINIQFYNTVYLRFNGTDREEYPECDTQEAHQYGFELMKPDYATVHVETTDGNHDYELRRELENKTGIEYRRHLMHIMDTFNKAEIESMDIGVFENLYPARVIQRTFEGLKIGTVRLTGIDYFRNADFAKAIIEICRSAKNLILPPLNSEFPTSLLTYKRDYVRWGNSVFKNDFIELSHLVFLDCRGLKIHAYHEPSSTRCMNLFLKIWKAGAIRRLEYFCLVVTGTVDIKAVLEYLEHTKQPQELCRTFKAFGDDGEVTDVDVHGGCDVKARDGCVATIMVTEIGTTPTGPFYDWHIEMFVHPTAIELEVDGLAGLTLEETR
ncbi:unnamed protein product [Caenorhabditis nigoni]